MSGMHPVRRTIHLASVSGMLALATAFLVSVTLGRIGSGGAASNTLAHVQHMLLMQSALPRIAVSLIAGAAMGLAGLLFQTAMRNELATPNTLGVSAGASLSLSLALAFGPTLLLDGRLLAASIGATLAMMLVLALCWRRNLSPAGVALTGMVVNLFCAAAAGLLQLVQDPYCNLLSLWSAGSLQQHGWSTVMVLAPGLVLGLLVAILLRRPVEALSMSDDVSRNLGLSPGTVRILALLVGVWLAALVTASVGLIAFVDLGAPIACRLLGARRLGSRLIWSPILGALLLCFADQLVQVTAKGGAEWLPTGLLTQAIGALTLLWLLKRLPAAEPSSIAETGLLSAHHRRSSAGWLLAIIGICLLLLCVVSLFVGASPDGWTVLSVRDATQVLPWRGPRLVGSASAGVLLTLAGTILQRTSGNPLAAPELLGIGAGAATGPVLLAALLPSESLLLQSAEAQCVAVLLGAGVAILVVLILTRRGGFQPVRVLLGGVALAGLFNTVTLLCLLGGNPRVQLMRGWLSGSTDLVSLQAACAVATAALCCTVLALIGAPWLTLLSLGDTVARSLGLGVAAARGALLLLAVVVTAASTVVVGPLGFVGLLGPHLARMAGLRHPRAQLLGGALIGAMLMVISDWVGRTVLFPYQLPAGLICSLLGAPVLIWMMRKGAIRT